jgi:hypothetical protein
MQCAARGARRRGAAATNLVVERLRLLRLLLRQHGIRVAGRTFHGRRGGMWHPLRGQVGRIAASRSAWPGRARGPSALTARLPCTCVNGVRDRPRGPCERFTSRSRDADGAARRGSWIKFAEVPPMASGAQRPAASWRGSGVAVRGGLPVVDPALELELSRRRQLLMVRRHWPAVNICAMVQRGTQRTQGRSLRCCC